MYIKTGNEYFTTALAGMLIFAALCWFCIIFFDKRMLYLFGAEETLLPLVVGLSAIWFAMPITDLVVAMVVLVKMKGSMRTGVGN